MESIPQDLISARVIPSTGAALPVIGCGTWKNFDVGGCEPESESLREVLGALFSSGGSVVDSSPMYGEAETVVGKLLARAGWLEKAFLATKVWTAGYEEGIKQMRRSFDLLGRVDLMQVHNLVDWRRQLATLREWKAEGRIRYLGVTHYAASAYGELEDVMRRETLDFVQLNYSLEERAAEKRLLPLAADCGIAVIVNLPFGAGRLLGALGNKPVPGWAQQCGCDGWAQLLLKFVLSNKAVTCVIPGTGDPGHMIENCRAGMGSALDARQCRDLRKLWDHECR